MKAFATFALPIAKAIGNEVLNQLVRVWRLVARFLKASETETSKQGGLAQLARALAWHARGHRFDSDILHK